MNKDVTHYYPFSPIDLLNFNGNIDLYLFEGSNVIYNSPVQTFFEMLHTSTSQWWNVPFPNSTSAHEKSELRLPRL